VYDGVVQYKRNEEIPDWIQDKTKFRKQFNDERLTRKMDKLYFDGVEIVRKADIDGILTKFYKKAENSIGVGIVAFYKKVRQEYLNIKRSEVAEFLQKQQTYQMTRSSSHRINKPITSDYPNQLWAVDLVELSERIPNTQHISFILNVVDVFSRKVFLFPLKKKLADNIAGCFKIIKQRLKVLPKYLMCDNGGEFMGDFEKYCEKEGIKIRNTRAYSPQSNGIVERKNREVRKRMNELIIRAENQRIDWRKLLNTVEASINGSYTDTIKGTPNDVWSPTNERVNLNEEQNELVKRVAKNTRDKIEKFKSKEFKEGDLVRAKMSSLYTSIRKLIKEGKGKDIRVNYSPDVYRISKVIISKKLGFTKNSYYLETLQGHALVVGAKDTPKRFYVNDLQEVPEDYKKGDMTMNQAVKLDKIEYSPTTDVHFNR
jgi:hypothetical protein